MPVAAVDIVITVKLAAIVRSKLDFGVSMIAPREWQVFALPKNDLNNRGIWMEGRIV